jgi:hypothetical protein
MRSWIFFLGVNSLFEMPNLCHKQNQHGVLVIEQRRRAGDGVIKPSKVTVPGLKNVDNQGERNEPN